jgi:hypothetical protein
MKKIMFICVTVLFLVTSITTAVTANITSVEMKEHDEIDELPSNFIHTVFGEYASATWCPPCATASEDLYAIYESGDYPFYYVSLVSDMNTIAKERVNSLAVYSIPAVFFDSGYIVETGAVGQAKYIENIEETGARKVKQPLEMTTSVTWEGDAKITVDVSIKNNGSSFYFGIVRSYITEIVSRWLTNQGDPYHFGFLGFAIKKLVFILPGKTISLKATWDGSKDHGGQTFEDITQENTMVISTVSHWIPRLKINEKGRLYFTFYVDQTSAGVPI